MKCILSHMAAYRWYVRHPNPRGAGERPCRVGLAGAVAPDCRSAGMLQWLLDLEDAPLDVLVDGAADRRSSALVQSHTTSCDLPAGSLVPIGPAPDGVELFAVSPELALMQLHRAAAPLDTVFRAMELCGAYRLDPFADDTLLQRPDGELPVTTPERIRGYAKRARGMRGRDGLMRLSRLLIAGARSPKEVGLAMFYGMPQRFGGMALGTVLLNPAVEVRAGADRFGTPRTETRYPDILMTVRRPGGAVAVAFDYDSDFAHQGSEKRHADMRRKNALATLPNLVHFTLVTGDLGDIDYLVLSGERARKILGLRKRPTLKVSAESAAGREQAERYRAAQQSLWERYVLSAPR